jgi:hypothetical protein
MELWGNTSSTSKAALSAMRRAPQLGRNPLRLQLKATRCSACQVLALHAQKPVFEPTAFEIFIEFSRDMGR